MVAEEAEAAMMRVEVKPELLRWTRERSGLVRGHACGLRGHACGARGHACGLCGDTPAGYAKCCFA
jgi:hypothetical protein